MIAGDVQVQLLDVELLTLRRGVDELHEKLVGGEPAEPRMLGTPA